MLKAIIKLIGSIKVKLDPSTPHDPRYRLQPLHDGIDIRIKCFPPLNMAGFKEVAPPLPPPPSLSLVHGI